MAFRNLVETKSSTSSSSSSVLPKHNRFFMHKKVQVPSLKELASIALIAEQCGTVEKVEDVIRQNPPEEIQDCIRGILAKIKKLHRYVIQNNVDAVDEFLTATPDYLLCVLLKTKSINQTSAFGMNHYVVVEGSALMMAMGADAYGREGCDLCLIPTSSPLENTTSKKLALQSNHEPASPLRYIAEGKECVIESGEGKDQLRAPHFDKLKAMLRSPFLLNKNLNLDHPALNEKQRNAYAALLRITRQRKHTLFVNEEGMVEVLQRHMRRAWLDDAKEEIRNQALEQFPEGWEEKEEKQYAADFKMLVQMRTAIANSTSDHDARLTAAFNTFKAYFEPEAKAILKQGKYGKKRLFQSALEIGAKEFFYNRRLDNLYYNQVVGWLQRLQQENVKQDIAQGVENIDFGKKSNRSLKYTSGERFFTLPQGSQSGIGFNSHVDVCLGEEQTEIRQMDGFLGSVIAAVLRNNAWEFFRNNLEANTKALQQILPRREKQQAKQSRCILM